MKAGRSYENHIFLKASTWSHTELHNAGHDLWNNGCLQSHGTSRHPQSSAFLPHWFVFHYCKEDGRIQE